MWNLNDGCSKSKLTVEKRLLGLALMMIGLNLNYHGLFAKFFSSKISISSRIFDSLAPIRRCFTAERIW
jgi:hypothetical protein